MIKYIEVFIKLEIDWEKLGLGGLNLTNPVYGAKTWIAFNEEEEVRAKESRASFIRELHRIAKNEYVKSFEIELKEEYSGGVAK